MTDEPARTILGIFAHPDDEATACAITFHRYANEGARIVVVTATRGEMGALGARGLVIRREDLGQVRLQEQQEVARLIGINEVVQLGHKDGGLKDVPQEDLVYDLGALLVEHKPSVVITHGPTGISNHPDHIAVSQAVTEAFNTYASYIQGGWVTGPAPTLLYPALPKEVIDQFGLKVEGVEARPNLVIDGPNHKAVKVQALRAYRSQEDAQWLADMFEQAPVLAEHFHQAHPPLLPSPMKTALW